MLEFVVVVAAAVTNIDRKLLSISLCFPYIHH
jgi:hypothetical protein